ncbi:MAG: hypothetical protein RMJ00_00990 [Nitrososphaerota archaeon]|nr:hypothetical protein [Candidatus Bathyarchaeota archaeon]MCX8161489.1 hypothetical protein [Candidatus Bathyarchaeota archaeon]MDW8061262.1 hypothetical protein [Nitrososphaerota archaeon]
MASGRPLLDIISTILSKSIDGLDEVLVSLDVDASKLVPMLLELGLLEVRDVEGRSVYVTSAKGKILLEEYELFRKNSSDTNC